MVVPMFAVRDQKAEMYEMPMVFLNEATARRAFARVANDTNDTHGKFPEDFELHMLGSFDDSKGRLISLDAPQRVCSFLDLVPKKEV